MDIFGFSRHLEQKWSIVASYIPKSQYSLFPLQTFRYPFSYFACHVIKILKNSSIAGAGKLLSPAKKWLFCVGVATKWFELQWRWLKVRCNCGNVSRGGNYPSAGLLCVGTHQSPGGKNRPEILKFQDGEHGIRLKSTFNFCPLHYCETYPARLSSSPSSSSPYPPP